MLARSTRKVRAPLTRHQYGTGCRGVGARQLNRLRSGGERDVCPSRARGELKSSAALVLDGNLLLDGRALLHLLARTPLGN
eukprot:4666780-Prymnesium_polylepis.1